MLASLLHEELLCVRVLPKLWHQGLCSQLYISIPHVQCQYSNDKTNTRIAQKEKIKEI